MARSFNGSTQYLEYAGAVVTSYPLTLCVAANIASTTNIYGQFGVYSTGTAQRFQLSYVGSVASIGWRAYGERPGEPAASYRQKGSLESSTGWSFAACSWVDMTAAPLLSVNGSTITGTSGASTNGAFSLDRTGVGSLTLGGSRFYYNGAHAECAVWNVALDQSELNAITKGHSPLSIRPSSLVAYWPLGGHHGQLDVDRWKNRYDLTPTGSPTWADHPRVFYPRRSFWFPSPLPAAPTSYTLEALPASVDVVGQSASLSAVRKLAAQPATIEVVGQEATLRVVRKIVASPATVDVVGQSATLTRARTLTANAAEVQVSGQAAGLTATRKITASPAAIEVVGQSANLRVVRRIVASPATVEVSGQTAVTRRTALLQGLAATIAVVGQAAVLTYSGEAAVVTEDWIGVDKATGRTPQATATHRVGTATAIGRVSKSTAYQRPV